MTRHCILMVIVICTFMDWLLEEFIISIIQDQFFRTLASSFVRNLGKTKLTLVKLYTVNLVVFFLDKKLPELLDRSNGGTSLLLPLTKDKEETHKLLNGSFGDAADWVCNINNPSPLKP